MSTDNNDFNYFNINDLTNPSAPVNPNKTPLQRLVEGEESLGLANRIETGIAKLNQPDPSKFQSFLHGFYSGTAEPFVDLKDHVTTIGGYYTDKQKARQVYLRNKAVRLYQEAVDEADVTGADVESLYQTLLANSGLSGEDINTLNLLPERQKIQAEYTRRTAVARRHYTETVGQVVKRIQRETRQEIKLATKGKYTLGDRIWDNLVTLNSNDIADLTGNAVGQVLMTLATSGLSNGLGFGIRISRISRLIDDVKKGQQALNRMRQISIANFGGRQVGELSASELRLLARQAGVSLNEVKGYSQLANRVKKGTEEIRRLHQLIQSGAPLPAVFDFMIKNSLYIGYGLQTYADVLDEIASTRGEVTKDDLLRAGVTSAVAQIVNKMAGVTEAKAGERLAKGLLGVATDTVIDGAVGTTNTLWRVIKDTSKLLIASKSKEGLKQAGKELGGKVSEAGLNLGASVGQKLLTVTGYLLGSGAISSASEGLSELSEEFLRQTGVGNGYNADLLIDSGLLGAIGGVGGLAAGTLSKPVHAAGHFTGKLIGTLGAFTASKFAKRIDPTYTLNDIGLTDKYHQISNFVENIIGESHKDIDLEEAQNIHEELLVKIAQITNNPNFKVEDINHVLEQHGLLQVEAELVDAVFRPNKFVGRVDTQDTRLLAENLVNAVAEKQLGKLGDKADLIEELTEAFNNADKALTGSQINKIASKVLKIKSGISSVIIRNAQNASQTTANVDSIISEVLSQYDVASSKYAKFTVNLGKLLRETVFKDLDLEQAKQAGYTSRLTNLLKNNTEIKSTKDLENAVLEAFSTATDNNNNPIPNIESRVAELNKGIVSDIAQIWGNKAQNAHKPTNVLGKDVKAKYGQIIGFLKRNTGLGLDSFLEGKSTEQLNSYLKDSKVFTQELVNYLTTQKQLSEEFKQELNLRLNDIAIKDNTNTRKLNEIDTKIANEHRIKAEKEAELNKVLKDTKDVYSTAKWLSKFTLEDLNKQLENTKKRLEGFNANELKHLNRLKKKNKITEEQKKRLKELLDIKHNASKLQNRIVKLERLIEQKKAFNNIKPEYAKQETTYPELIKRNLEAVTQIEIKKLQEQRAELLKDLSITSDTEQNTRATQRLVIIKSNNDLYDDFVAEVEEQTGENLDKDIASQVKKAIKEITGEFSKEANKPDQAFNNWLNASKAKIADIHTTDINVQQLLTKYSERLGNTLADTRNFGKDSLKQFQEDVSRLTEEFTNNPKSEKVIKDIQDVISRYGIKASLQPVEAEKAFLDLVYKVNDVGNVSLATSLVNSFYSNIIDTKLDKKQVEQITRQFEVAFNKASLKGKALDYLKGFTDSLLGKKSEELNLSLENYNNSVAEGINSYLGSIEAQLTPLKEASPTLYKIIEENILNKVRDDIQNISALLQQHPSSHKALLDTLANAVLPLINTFSQISAEYENSPNVLVSQSIENLADSYGASIHQIKAELSKYTISHNLPTGHLFNLDEEVQSRALKATKNTINKAFKDLTNSEKDYSSFKRSLWDELKEYANSEEDIQDLSTMLKGVTLQEIAQSALGDTVKATHHFINQIKQLFNLDISENISPKELIKDLVEYSQHTLEDFKDGNIPKEFESVINFLQGAVKETIDWGRVIYSEMLNKHSKDKDRQGKASLEEDIDLDPSLDPIEYNAWLKVLNIEEEISESFKGLKAHERLAKEAFAELNLPLLQKHSETLHKYAWLQETKSKAIIEGYAYLNQQGEGNFWVYRPSKESGYIWSNTKPKEGSYYRHFTVETLRTKNLWDFNLTSGKELANAMIVEAKLYRKAYDKSLEMQRDLKATLDGKLTPEQVRKSLEDLYLKPFVDFNIREVQAFKELRDYLLKYSDKSKLKEANEKFFEEITKNSTKKEAVNPIKDEELIRNKDIGEILEASEEKLDVLDGSNLLPASVSDLKDGSHTDYLKGDIETDINGEISVRDPFTSEDFARFKNTINSADIDNSTRDKVNQLLNLMEMSNSTKVVTNDSEINQVLEEHLPELIGAVKESIGHKVLVHNPISKDRGKKAKDIVENTKSIVEALKYSHEVTVKADSISQEFVEHVINNIPSVTVSKTYSPEGSVYHFTRDTKRADSYSVDNYAIRDVLTKIGKELKDYSSIAKYIIDKGYSKSIIDDLAGNLQFKQSIKKEYDKQKTAQENKPTQTQPIIPNNSGLRTAEGRTKHLENLQGLFTLPHLKELYGQILPSLLSNRQNINIQFSNDLATSDLYNLENLPNADREFLTSKGKAIKGYNFADNIWINAKRNEDITFDKDGKITSISENTQVTLLHELLHTYLGDLITTDKNAKDFTKSLKKSLKTAFNELSKTDREKLAGSKAIQYMLSKDADLSEILTIILTDANVANWAMSQKILANENIEINSIYKQAKDTLKQLFAKGKEQATSLLDNVLDIFVDQMSKIDRGFNIYKAISESNNKTTVKDLLANTDYAHIANALSNFNVPINKLKLGTETVYRKDTKILVLSKDFLLNNSTEQVIAEVLNKAFELNNVNKRIEITHKDNNFHRAELYNQLLDISANTTNLKIAQDLRLSSNWLYWKGSSVNKQQALSKVDLTNFNSEINNIYELDNLINIAKSTEANKSINVIGDLHTTELSSKHSIVEFNVKSTKVAEGDKNALAKLFGSMYYHLSGASIDIGVDTLAITPAIAEVLSLASIESINNLALSRTSVNNAVGARKQDLINIIGKEALKRLNPTFNETKATAADIAKLEVSLGALALHGLQASKVLESDRYLTRTELNNIANSHDHSFNAGVYVNIPKIEIKGSNFNNFSEELVNTLDTFKIHNTAENAVKSNKVGKLPEKDRQFINNQSKAEWGISNIGNILSNLYKKDSKGLIDLLSGYPETSGNKQLSLTNYLSKLFSVLDKNDNKPIYKSYEVNAEGRVVESNSILSSQVHTENRFILATNRHKVAIDSENKRKLFLKAVAEHLEPILPVHTITKGLVAKLFNANRADVVNLIETLFIDNDGSIEIGDKSFTGQQLLDSVKSLKNGEISNDLTNLVKELGKDNKKQILPIITGLFELNSYLEATKSDTTYTTTLTTELDSKGSVVAIMGATYSSYGRNLESVGLHTTSNYSKKTNPVYYSPELGLRDLLNDYEVATNKDQLPSWIQELIGVTGKDTELTGQHRKALTGLIKQIKNTVGLLHNGVFNDSSNLKDIVIPIYFGAAEQDISNNLNELIYSKWVNSNKSNKEFIEASKASVEVFAPELLKLYNSESISDKELSRLIIKELTQRVFGKLIYATYAKDLGELSNDLQLEKQASLFMHYMDKAILNEQAKLHYRKSFNNLTLEEAKHIKSVTSHNFPYVDTDVYGLDTDFIHSVDIFGNSIKVPITVAGKRNNASTSAINKLRQIEARIVNSVLGSKVEYAGHQIFDGVRVAIDQVDEIGIELNKALYKEITLNNPMLSTAEGIANRFKVFNHHPEFDLLDVLTKTFADDKVALAQIKELVNNPKAKEVPALFNLFNGLSKRINDNDSYLSKIKVVNNFKGSVPYLVSKTSVNYIGHSTEILKKAKDLTKQWGNKLPSLLQNNPNKTNWNNYLIRLRGYNDKAVEGSTIIDIDTIAELSNIKHLKDLDKLENQELINKLVADNALIVSKDLKKAERFKRLVGKWKTGLEQGIAINSNGNFSIQGLVHANDLLSKDSQLFSEYQLYVKNTGNSDLYSFFITHYPDIAQEISAKYPDNYNTNIINPATNKSKSEFRFKEEIISENTIPEIADDLDFYEEPSASIQDPYLRRLVKTVIDPFVKAKLWEGQLDIEGVPVFPEKVDKFAPEVSIHMTDEELGARQLIVGVLEQVLQKGKLIDIDRLNKIASHLRANIKVDNNLGFLLSQSNADVISTVLASKKLRTQLEPVLNGLWEQDTKLIKAIYKSIDNSNIANQELVPQFLAHVSTKYINDNANKTTLLDQLNITSAIDDLITEHYPDSWKTPTGDISSSAWADSISNKLKKDNKPRGWLESLVKETTNHFYNHAPKMLVDWFNRSKLLEVEKNSMQDSIKSLLVNSFKDKKAMRKYNKSITEGMLHLDLSSVAHYFGKNEFDTLINYDAGITKSLKDLESAITNNLGSLAEGVLIDAEHLANYLATGEVTTNNLLINAHNIYWRLGHSNEYNAMIAKTKNMTKEQFKATLSAIDAYTSLLALQKRPEIIQDLRDLADTDALTQVAHYHNAGKRDFTHKRPEGLQSRVIKGAIAREYSTNRRLDLVTAKDFETLKKNGWVLLEQKSIGKNSKDEDVYLAYTNQSGNNPYIAGILNRTGHTRVNTGINVSSTDLTISEYLSKVNPEVSNVVPEYEINSKGEFTVLGYSYHMANEKKNNLMDASFDFLTTLSVNTAVFHSFNKAKALNKDIIKGLATEYLQATPEQKKSYVEVSPNAPTAIGKQAFESLPLWVKEEIAEIAPENTKLMVHRDYLNEIFGFKKLGLQNALDARSENLVVQATANLLAKITGNRAYKGITTVNNVITDIVKTANNFIIIRTGTVLFNNILGNMKLMVLAGYNPINVAKDVYYSWKGLNEFSKLTNEYNLARASYKVNPSKENDTKLKLATSAMRNHSFYEFHKSGMLGTNFNFEAGDITERAYRTDALHNVHQAYQGLREEGSLLINILDNVFVNKGTKPYQVLNHLSSASDAVFRIATYKAELRKGTEHDVAVRKAIKSFIDYALPTSRGMQFLNDISVFSYTKYALRSIGLLLDRAINAPFTFMLNGGIRGALVGFDFGLMSLIPNMNMFSAYRFLPELLTSPAPINAISEIVD